MQNYTQVFKNYHTKKYEKVYNCNKIRDGCALSVDFKLKACDKPFFVCGESSDVERPPFGWLS